MQSTTPAKGGTVGGQLWLTGRISETLSITAEKAAYNGANDRGLEHLPDGGKAELSGPLRAIRWHNA